MVKRCSAKSCFNSQLTHKVAYFGFPKNERIAREWARRAGRDDLCEKKIGNLTKYFLCSDHFIPADFVNPHSEKAFLILNRSNQQIPLPSKFENNLHKNLQSAKQNADNFTKYYRAENERVPRRGAKRKSEEPVKHESDMVAFKKKCDEDEFVNVVEYIEEIDDLCRLCAKVETDMIQIFNDSGELTADAQCFKLMPDIKFNDGLPQMACFNCIEKLANCAYIIDGFESNQQLFLN